MYQTPGASTEIRKMGTVVILARFSVSDEGMVQIRMNPDRSRTIASIISDSRTANSPARNSAGEAKTYSPIHCLVGRTFLILGEALKQIVLEQFIH
jgi:hypothetical protein